MVARPSSTHGTSPPMESSLEFPASLRGASEEDLQASIQTLRAKGKSRRLSNDSSLADYGGEASAKADSSIATAPSPISKSGSGSPKQNEEYLGDVNPFFPMSPSRSAPLSPRHRQTSLSFEDATEHSTCSRRDSTTSFLSKSHPIRMAPSSRAHQRRCSAATSAWSGPASSSAGTPNDFQFFEPSSFASTALTSPGSSPSRDSKSFEAALRNTTASEISVSPPLALSKQRFVDDLRPEQSPADGLDNALFVRSRAHNPVTVAGTAHEGRRRAQSTGALAHVDRSRISGSPEHEGSNPSSYFDIVPSRQTNSDTPPGYVSEERLPRYSEHIPKRHASPTVGRLRHAIADRAAASRIVPSRIAARLQAVASERLVAGSHGEFHSDFGNGGQGLRVVSRSDSAPELPDSDRDVLVSARPRLQQARDWTASQYISGARMGPSPSGIRRDGSGTPSSRSFAISLADSSSSVKSFTSNLKARTRAYVANHSRTPRSTASSLRASTRPSSRNEVTTQANQSLLTDDEVVPAPASADATDGSGSATIPSHPRISYGDDYLSASISEGGARSEAQYGDFGSTQSSEQIFLHYSKADRGERGQLAAGRSPISSDSAAAHVQQSTVGLSSSTVTSRRLVATRSPLRAPLLSPPVVATCTFHAGAAEALTAGATDSFNTLLPKEIRIRILHDLVDLYTCEHQDDIAQGRYRGAIARRQSPVGRNRGLQELLKLSCVNKAFYALVHDGQLWQIIRIPAANPCDESVCLALAASAGKFLRTLDLSGLHKLSSASLQKLTESLSQVNSSGHSTTNLVSLNISGMKHLSRFSVHSLVSTSPKLEILFVRNLPQVDDYFVRQLARWCTRLQELDISRCPGADGRSLESLLSHHNRLAVKNLRVLRAAKAIHLRKELFRSIADLLPNLEILDLSYASGLTDECLAEWTKHQGPGAVLNEHGSHDQPYVELTARQVSTQNNIRTSDRLWYRAAFPQMKHLCLASTGITGEGCQWLAWGALPNLEILELGHNIHLRDDGLIELLSSSRHLRRLDLEGASHLTDDTIRALTPPKSLGEDSLNGGALPHSTASTLIGREQPLLPFQTPSSPAPGSQLTHLILSGLVQVQSAALTELVARCTKLRHLEVDDTLVKDDFAEFFVKLVRQRCTHDMKQPDRMTTSIHKPTNSYLSVIDCRHLHRQACNDMLATGAVRPRLGQRSPAFNFLQYGDHDIAVPLTQSLAHPEQTRNMLEDECNEERVCVKAFWFWQAVDRHERLKAKKAKTESKKIKQAALLVTSATSTGALAALGIARSQQHRGETSRSSRLFGGRNSSVLNAGRSTEAATDPSMQTRPNATDGINAMPSRLSRLFSHGSPIDGARSSAPIRRLRSDGQSDDADDDDDDDDDDYNPRHLCVIV